MKKQALELMLDELKRVMASPSSIFARQDVADILSSLLDKVNSLEEEPVKEAQKKEVKLDKDLVKKWVFDAVECITFGDYIDSYDLSIDYHNRISIETIDMQTDSIADEIVDNISDKFYAIFEDENENEKLY